MADRDDSLMSTQVILAAAFGAAAVLVGVLFTLKADKIETKIVFKEVGKDGNPVVKHRKNNKGAAKEKTRHAADAAERQRRSTESIPNETVGSTPLKRKKGIAIAAEAPAAPAVIKPSGNGDQKVAKSATLAPEAKSTGSRVATPIAKESRAALAATKQHQTHLQHSLVEGKQIEGEGESAGGEDGGADEGAASGQSKSRKRKQRTKKSKPATGSAASSSGLGTPQESEVRGGGSATPPSTSDDMPGDEFTVVSNLKSSRKKATISRPANSSGNSALSQADPGLALNSGRFNLLASDTFVY